MKNKKLLILALIALFAAIISVSGFLRIPIGTIPIVLQNVLCILTATILGSYLGGIPTLLFLVAGLIGLPVYSGGTSGIAVWLGPTGGFLPGYLIGAVAAGYIAGKPSVLEKKFSWKILIKLTIAVFAGMILLYIPGIIHFSRWATQNGKIPVDKSALNFTLLTCVVPYIPGDLIKSFVAVPVALKIRPILAQYFSESE